MPKHVDMAAVHPFDLMKLPIKSVAGHLSEDEKSVWVGVSDNQNVAYWFVFRHDNGVKGGWYASYNLADAYDSGALPVSDAVAARAVILRLLKEKGPCDKESTSAYDRLSGRTESLVDRFRRYGLKAFVN